MNDPSSPGKKLGQPLPYTVEDVMVAVVVHIPHMLGYFSNRLEVLKLCLKSLIAHSPAGIEITIFDNASCKEVNDYLARLQRTGGIQHFIRVPRNIGKLAAMKVLFNGIGRSVVAFSDDDVFFYPGWLEPQLSILNTFPQVGAVSGVPTIDGASFALSSLERLLTEHPTDIQYKKVPIPEDWEADWALSTGRAPTKRRELARTERVRLISYDEVTAYAGATHFQFLAPREVICAQLPVAWPNYLMGGVRELDEALDVAGYLRLSTTERYARHIGNAIQKDLRDEATSIGIQTREVLRRPGLTFLERLPMKSGRVRTLGRKFYRQLGLLLDGEGIRNIQ